MARLVLFFQRALFWIVMVCFVTSWIWDFFFCYTLDLQLFILLHFIFVAALPHTGFVTALPHTGTVTVHFVTPRIWDFLLPRLSFATLWISNCSFCCIFNLQLVCFSAIAWKGKQENLIMNAYWWLYIYSTWPKAHHKCKHALSCLCVPSLNRDWIWEICPFD